MGSDLAQQDNQSDLPFPSLLPKDAKSFSVFMYTLILCGLYIGFGYMIVWQMKTNGFKYFGVGWNWLDMAAFVLFVTHLAFRIATCVSVSGEVNLAPERVGHPELFMPFSRAALSSVARARTLLAFLALIVWMKTLKYMCVFQGFRLMVRVMAKALVQLVVFSLVVLVIFFAFAIAFYVGYGGMDERFTTISGSFLILFFYLVGGFELNLSNWFVPGADTSRPLIFLVYLLLTYFILVNVFMAIVLDAYTMTVVVRKTVSTLPRKARHEKEEDGDAKNPLITFLYTYYHHSRGIDLIGEEEKNEDDSEYSVVDLEDLPGIIAKKWLQKKKRMIDTIKRISGDAIDVEEDQQRLPQHHQQGIEDDEDDEDVEFDEDGNMIVHPRRHGFEQEEIPSFTQTFKKSTAKLKGRFLNALMPESQKALQNIKHIPVTIKSQLTTKGLYEDDNMNNLATIGRPQLQRLLDEDKALRILLGSGDALSVIKRFKYIPDADAAQEALTRELEGALNGENSEEGDEREDLKWQGGDSQAINTLQEVVFARLDKLEKSNLNVDSVEVPQIKLLSNQLADMLSDVQNCWREGIISVLESATLISASLLQFTKSVESVSLNHKKIHEAMCIDSGSDEEESAEGSSGFDS